MKRILIVAAFCLVLGSIFSSCNNEVCPAYTQAEIEQPAEIG